MKGVNNMSNIIRDSREMELFSQAVEQFDDNIGRICTKMESAVSMAEYGMRDESTKPAANILSELIAAVKEVTNPLDDIGASISKAAKTLERTESIRFRR